MTQKRLCLLVLGMHRSGTSALTRSLNLLGAALPKTLLRPGPDNPDGFWESELFVQHDDRILSEAGLRWQDPWNLPDGLFEGEAAAHRAADLAALIDEEIGATPFFVIKEPRICRLLPLWRRALDLAGCEVSVILALRDPTAVAQSVHRRDGLPMPTALLLWLRHVLEAEHGSRDLPRVILRYEDLMADWRTALGRVGAGLGIDWPARTPETEAAIDELLRGHPTREGAADPGPETSLMREWAGPVYRDLIAGAAEQASFDRVRAEIERADALLGPAARLGANWSVPEIWQLRAGLDRARGEVGKLRRLLHVARGEAARTVDDRTTRDAALARYGQAITRLFDTSGRAVDAVQRYRDMGQRYFDMIGRFADGANRYRSAAYRYRDQAARYHDEAVRHGDTIRQYEDTGLVYADTAASYAETARSYEDATRRYSETAARYADLAGRYDAIVKSTSWRLTRPLRRVMALLKRQPEDAQAEPDSSAPLQDAAERREDAAASLEAVKPHLADAASRRYDAEARRRDAASRSPDAAATTEDAESLPADAESLAAEAAHLTSETGPIWAEIARREAASLIARSCLFDPDYYRDSHPELAADIDPLIHFIDEGAALSWNPNPWFDLAFYKAANPRLAASGANPLIDYIEIGAWEGPDPHPGFDQAAYLARNAHLASRYITPLGHFLLYAAAPGGGTAAEKTAHAMRVIAQSGLFDSQYYREAAPDCGDDALRHYVETGSADPNAWFDTAFYVGANTRLAQTGGNPLLDYIEHGAWEGPDPHPGFDNARYLREHPDLATRYMTPLAHFLIYGVPSWLAPSPALAPPPPLPIDQSLAPLDPAEGWAWDRMLRSGALVPAATSRLGEPGEFFGTAGRAKILLVSHEFSRTGAPLILLRLVQALARRIDAELYVFTDKSGPLETEFAAEAHVLNGDVFLPFAGGNGIFSLPRLLEKLAPPAPMLAICNTANTQAYGLAFREAGIPVINLVHEAASGYAEATYRGLFTAADRVVFSSRYVLELARAKIGDLASEARLIGQGLLNPGLLEGDRAQAAAHIRTSLGLGEAARIVLTCGSLDLRKGADLFLDVALAVLRGGAAETHFVWVGDGDTGRPALGWWLAHDEAVSGYADRIHFLGSLDDTAPWFLGSDLFLLTSREDPFPCVAHEAMASGLPLIGFEQASGAVEALGGTGVFVPYLDVAAMARAVAELLASPSRRRYLTEAARDRVIAEYDFADYVTRLIDLAAELGVVLPRLI